MKNQRLPESRPEKRLRRDLRLGMWDAFLSTPLVMLALPANVIMASLFTQYFGLSKSTYGLLVSMPSWFNCLQIVLLPLLKLSPRRATLVFAWGQLVVWSIMAIGLPFVPHDPGVAGKVFLLFTVGSAACGALAAVAWIAWVRDFVPGRVRGVHLGKRNRLAGVATLTFLLFAGLISARFPNRIETYVILIGVAIIFRMIGLACLSATSSATGGMQSVRWLHGISGILHNKPFLLFLTFSVWVVFWLNAVNPFIPVFMYEELGLEISGATTLLVMNSAMGALSMPLWGRLMDRHGCAPIITLSLFWWMGVDYLWVLVTPSQSWMLYLMWISGGMSAPGFLLGTFNMILKLTPREHTSGAASVNLSVTAFAAAVAPIVSGLIVSQAEASSANVGFLYRVGFFLKPTLVLLGIFILRKVKEPETLGESTVSGAMRTARQAMIGGGLAFLANFNFVRRQRNLPPKR